MTDKKFPFKIEGVEPKLNEELMKCYTGERTGFVRVGPKGYFMTKEYEKEAADIYNLPIRPDDIFIVTYPRSGTTWSQEMIWLVKNDLDYEGAKEPLDYRFPFMEYSCLFNQEIRKILYEKNKHDPSGLEPLQYITEPTAPKVAKMTSPRFLKTHMPMSLLPPNMLDTAKVVYVVRDPRDVVVSFYHLHKLLIVLGAECDFKTYWNYFIRGLTYWAPFFEHAKEAWELRHHPNMLFIHYEDMIQDLPSVIRKVAALFDKQYTEEQIKGLCDHLAFDNFKKNPAISSPLNLMEGYELPGQQGFVRKGKSGGWRDFLDDEMTAQMEQWMRDNLKDTDLRFPTFPMD